MGALSFPGERVTGEDEIISRFRDKFCQRLPHVWLDLDGRSTAQAPAYTTYDAWNIITRAEMAELPIRARLPVYLWVERPLPGVIWRTTWKEWIDHALARRPLGPRPDTYVFDDTVEWCFVYTHEWYREEDLIFVSSGLPLGRPFGAWKKGE